MELSKPVLLQLEIVTDLQKLGAKAHKKFKETHWMAYYTLSQDLYSLADRIRALDRAGADDLPF